MIDIDKPINLVPVDLEPPPAKPMPRLCWRRGYPETCIIVTKQSWAEARAKAAVTLKCEPGEVIARLPEEEK